MKINKFLCISVVRVHRTDIFRSGQDLNPEPLGCSSSNFNARPLPQSIYIYVYIYIYYIYIYIYNYYICRYVCEFYCLQRIIHMFSCLPRIKLVM